MADIGEKNYLINGVAQESTVQNIVTQVGNVATNASTAATKATAAASDAANIKSTIGTVNTNTNTILSTVNNIKTSVSSGSSSIKRIQSGRVSYAWQGVTYYATKTWRTGDHGAAYFDITISAVSDINKCEIKLWTLGTNYLPYLINATTLRIVTPQASVGSSATEGSILFDKQTVAAFIWEVIEYN